MAIIAFSCFNRINPNRSIPTQITRDLKINFKATFQSYQSKQINPDTTLADPVVARLSDAEWRNLFLKD